MFKPFLLFMMVLLSSGCATTYGAKNLSSQSVSQIIRGQTTKSQVQAIFGSPSSKVVTNTEPVAGVKMPYEIWSYAKITEDAASGLGFAPMKTMTLAINFDRAGIVQNYSTVETS